MLHRLSIAMFTGLAILGCSVEAQEKNDDKKAIQGIWNAKKGDVAAKLTVTAEKFTFEIRGSSIKGTIVIDSAKTPKHMDWVVTESSDEKSKRFVGKTVKAIYELQGDLLKWRSQSNENEDRPTAFPQEGDNSPGMYLVFEREKK